MAFLKIRIFISMLLALTESAGIAGIVTIQAPFPDRAHSIETIEQSILSLMLFNSRLFGFPDRDYFVTVPFRDVGSTREERFGTLIQQQRIKSPIENYKMGQAFPIPYGKNFLLFDGDALEMTHVSESFELLAKRSIVADLVKAPKDRGGDAPWTETERLRGKFMKKFHLSRGLKFAGAAHVPRSWWVAEGNRVFLTSKWDTFPLFSMLCDQDDPSRCSLEYVCFVHGIGDAANIRGLAVREDLRLLLFGNEATNVISVVKFNSCFDSILVGKISLPSKMKKMTDVFVDEKNRLWVSTLQPDDYNNASVFVWEPKDWWGP